MKQAGQETHLKKRNSKLTEEANKTVSKKVDQVMMRQANKQQK